MTAFPSKSILLLLICSIFAVPECTAAPAMAKKENGALAETSAYLTKSDLAKIYQLLTSSYKDQSLEDITPDQVPFSLLKRKFDDYGHLRFGRSNGNGNNRFKYSDPDYGHMRFGK